MSFEGSGVFAFFLAGFGFNQIRPRLPGAGRRGLIILASAKPNRPCLATFGLQARDRASLARKDAGPVPVPNTGGLVGREVFGKPHQAQSLLRP